MELSRNSIVFGFVCISWIHYVFHCPKSKLYWKHSFLYTKIKISGIYLLLLCLHCLLYLIYQRKKTREMYLNELQANGIYKFYFAFVHSELTTSNFTKRYQLRSIFSVKATNLLQRIVLCETSKCSCWTT
jgi:hypothetical protein